MLLISSDVLYCAIVDSCVYFFVFFFFKQKTAYEIKECDWSSDVCSSELGSRPRARDSADHGGHGRRGVVPFHDRPAEQRVSQQQRARRARVAAGRGRLRVALPRGAERRGRRLRVRLLSLRDGACAPARDGRGGSRIKSAAATPGT